MKPEAPSYHELIPGGFECCNNQTHTKCFTLALYWFYWKGNMKGIKRICPLSTFFLYNLVFGDQSHRPLVKAKAKLIWMAPIIADKGI